MWRSVNAPPVACPIRFDDSAGVYQLEHGEVHPVSCQLVFVPTFESGSYVAASIVHYKRRKKQPPWKHSGLSFHSA